MAEQDLVQLQQIGLSAEKMTAFTGADRVIAINTETRRIHIHDGKTPGGVQVPLMSDITDPNAAEVEYKNYGYANVGEALDALLYKKIEITAFSNNVNTVEMGRTITSVTFNWNYNKQPKKLELDAQNLDVSLKSTTLSDLSITSNKSWTLKATDEKDAVATRTTGVSFLNGMYTGVGTVEADGVNNDFIKSLSKTLTGSKAKTFTVNAAGGQYIYYAIPARFGTPTFKVGGFEGGFELLKTFEFTNASGYAESYVVYRSSNAGLGNTTVEVK